MNKKRQYNVKIVSLVFTAIYLIGCAIFFFANLNIILIIFALILLYLSLYDIRNFEIPWWPTLLLLLTGLAFKIFEVYNGENFFDLYWLLTIISAFGLIFVVSRFYRSQVFGSGDYMVIGAIALVLEYKGLFVALEASIIIAAAIGIILVKTSTKLKISNTLIPLVPFLAFGWLIALNFTDEIWNFLFIN